MSYLPVPVEPTGIYVPSDWGKIWKPKRNAAGGAKATVAIIGDSIVNVGASLPFGTTLSGRLRADLQAAYGNGGSGFIGVSKVKGPLWDFGVTNPNNFYATADCPTSTGTWSMYTSNASTDPQYSLGTVGDHDGPAACFMLNTSHGDGSGPYVAGTLTFPVVTGTTLKVYYVGNCNAFTVSIDGGTATTVTPPGTATTQAASFSVSAGSHSIVITAPANYVEIYGVSGENATGVVVNDFSRAGWGTGAFNPGTFPFGHPADWSGGDSYPCDLLIYQLGNNDLSKGGTPATWLTNARATLERILGGTTRQGAADLMISMAHIGKEEVAVSSQTWHQYLENARALADSYGAIFCNVWGGAGRGNWYYWDGLGAWSDSAGGIGHDNQHLSDVGMGLHYAHWLKTPIVRG